MIRKILILIFLLSFSTYSFESNNTKDVCEYLKNIRISLCKSIGRVNTRLCRSIALDERIFFETNNISNGDLVRYHIDTCYFVCRTGHGPYNYIHECELLLHTGGLTTNAKTKGKTNKRVWRTSK